MNNRPAGVTRIGRHEIIEEENSVKEQRTGGIPSGFPWVAAILVPALVVAVLSAGCLSQAGPGAFSPAGGSGTGTTVTRIGSIIENPALYENRTVVIEGKITLECSSGCWFNLDDGSGTIYVDLNARNFAIPQEGGARAVVTGTVKTGAAGPSLLGEKVEVGGRVYP